MPALEGVFPVFELGVSVLPPLLLLHVLLHISNAAAPLEQGVEVEDFGLGVLCIHSECHGAYQRHDSYDFLHDDMIILSIRIIDFVCKSRQYPENNSPIVGKKSLKMGKK